MDLCSAAELRAPSTTQKVRTHGPDWASDHPDAGEALVESTLILAAIAIVALAAFTQLGSAITGTLNQPAGNL
jgi:Flp pilus assembly pilin Flp